MSEPTASIDEIVVVLSRATGLPPEEATPLGHAEFAAMRIRNLVDACDERNALLDVLRANGIMERGLALAERVGRILAEPAPPFPGGRY